MGARTRLWVASAVLASCLVSGAARAQATGQVEVGPPMDLSSSLGLPVQEIRVETLGALWAERYELTQVRLGEPLTAEYARRAMREILREGRVADVQAAVENVGGAVILILRVVPRRVIRAIRWEDSKLTPEEGESALGFAVGGAVTAYSLRDAATALENAHGQVGYPNATVEIVPEDTDDEQHIVLRVRVTPGEPQRVEQLKLAAFPVPHHPMLAPVLRSYGVRRGTVQDERALADADEALEAELRSRRWFDAVVEHRIEEPGRVIVDVKAGPRYRLRFVGNSTFSSAILESALDVGSRESHREDLLAGVVRDFYVARGFLDADVRAIRFSGPAAAEVAFHVQEGPRVRVVRRLYPCLKSKKAEEIGAELDGVLSQELPAPDFLEAVDRRAVDESVGPPEDVTERPPGARLEPWQTFEPEVYERALTHLEEVLRSQGYLSAQVGPATLVRRQCDPRFGPNECRVGDEFGLPDTECTMAEDAEPFAEPIHQTCEADRARGIRCEPDATLVLPVRMGRQAVLYDVAFEGNRALTEAELLDAAELDVGGAVSTAELDAARRRIVERYGEEAFAFAEVTTDLQVSPDGTRARATFSVSEREPVRIREIVVRGARRTRESLIRGRFALQAGGLYRSSDVARTQHQIESLGVFSSVAVALEDPGVPAREKTVVVTVVERLPQYLDVKGGFSTGEGFRVGFEYGHRNLVGQAIAMTIRAQLGLRPPALIFERDVRVKYEALSFAELLERRNTLTFAFPDVGLGPLYSGSVEGLDVHDNARDFGITKDAVFVRLVYRPIRELWAQIGASIELNDANIFGAENKAALEAYVQDNPEFANTVRVPEGTTLAFAQRAGVVWDRRDHSLEATRGTLVQVGVEHVSAVPVDETAGHCNEDSESVFAATCSELMRYTNRLAAYLPLDDEGLSLAASFQWGLIQQLNSESRTYPDRLFFMGGVDTIRGYLQDSLVPQDIADQLVDPASGLTINEVVLRGGDVFINPRLELRIPLTKTVRTALFVDAGNLWTNPDDIDPTELRYAVGTGLRIGTPVGPLVFDYGFNVERLVDVFRAPYPGERYWEDVGAFHFSIGLF